MATVIKGADLKEVWDDFLLTGNNESYRQLYLNYYHYLNFLGTKRGFPVVKIKDAINDVFYYLWEKREQLSSVENHHNYIITSFLYKLYKKDKFAPEDGAELMKSSELLVSQSPETEMILKHTEAEIANTLKSYIEKLPEKQRLMIYQKFYLGLSYQEISKLNNVSINTVYNTVYNAIDKLRLSIDKEELDSLMLSFSIFYLFSSFFQK